MQDLPPLPYLRGERWGYELRLEVDLEPEGDQVGPCVLQRCACSCTCTA